MTRLFAEHYQYKNYCSNLRIECRPCTADHQYVLTSMDSKVVVEGRSMVNIISVASELGYLNVPENTLIEIDQLKNYPRREDNVLITTGSQGESMAALSRMAADIA